MKLPEDPRVREAVGIAMKSLVRRSRLSGEIARNLRTRGFSDEEIESALACLEEHRLIDDEGAIREHVEARSGRRAVGSGKLQAELERRGADFDGVLALRTDEQEVAALQNALEGRRWDPNDRDRAGRFLASRGFDSELIETALERFFGPEE